MMNQFLAEHYGTKVASAQTQEVDAGDVTELSKEAQIELFCKLAAQNEIDLDKLSEAEIQHLWAATFSKEASEDEGKKDDEKEKESEGEPSKDDAKKEHEEKKEAMAKMAEADFLGRVMAHSMVQELRKIAEAQDAGEQPAEGEDKEAAAKDVADKLKNFGAKALDKAKGTAGRAGELLSGSKAKNLKSKAETAIRAAGDAKASGSKTQAGWQGLAKKYAPAAKEEAGKVRNARIGAGVAGAAAVGGGAAMAMKKKESSAIDELAAVEAVKTAGLAGYDLDEVSEKVAAALEIIGESEKVASVSTVDEAIGVRALELLETAGYPVTWES